MANEEHLALLRQGVAVWNAWREATPYPSQPDLSGAEFSEVDLCGADLSEVDLTGACLNMANLEGANLEAADIRYAQLVAATLSGANLRNAGLGGADLQSADLTGADLSRAMLIRANLKSALLGGDSLTFRTNLTDTDLTEANLTGAALSQADLVGQLTGVSVSGADFTRCILGSTLFANIDLSKANGLETCRHLGPSIIDHRTLQRSGQLPLTFLRGCGLPDNLIDYLPSLLNQPIQFYSCFISYSSEDDEFVHRLHADLQNEGIRCWFAPEDMKIGDRTRPRIDEVIHLHEKLLLVLSENSINSDWVEKEVETDLPPGTGHSV